MSLKDRLDAARARALTGAPPPYEEVAFADDDPSLLSVTELQAEVSAVWFSLDRHAVRSPGWHVMEVIADLEQAWLSDREKRQRSGVDPDGFSEEDLEGFAAVGFLWERILGRALTEIEMDGDSSLLFAPGEQELDAIFGTPDRMNSRERALEEWKATWLSARSNLRQRKERWIIQMMCYCWMLGVNRANLRVLYVNGNYERYKMGAPLVRIYRWRWTDEQLQETWEMVRGHRDEMVAQGKRPKKEAA